MKTLNLFLCIAGCLVWRVRAQEKGAIIGKSCNYLFTFEAYHFTSPGYPEYYPNNATCTWKIVAESGYHIQLTIIDVDIEVSKHCQFDSVTIYDGENETAIPVRKLCGTKLPENVQSISNVLTITMESDRYQNGKGFQMKYKTTPACTSVYRDSSGSTESPGYPFGYPDGLYCSYHLFAEKGKYIHVYFEDFELEEMQRYECLDYISLLTTSEDNVEKLQGQFCGTSLRKSGLCFKAQKLTIRFVTDNDYNLRGFKIAFMVSDDVCAEDEKIENTKEKQGKAVLTEDLMDFNELVRQELGMLSKNFNDDLPANNRIQSHVVMPTQQSYRKTSVHHVKQTLSAYKKNSVQKIEFSSVRTESLSSTIFKLSPSTGLPITSYTTPTTSKSNSKYQQLQNSISTTKNMEKLSTKFSQSNRQVNSNIQQSLMKSETSILLSSVVTSNINTSIYKSVDISKTSSEQLTTFIPWNTTTVKQSKEDSLCSKYLSIEIKDGGVPLSNMNPKEMKSVKDLLNSKITVVWEVAWPYEGVMGEEGIMHYGTLLTVNQKKLLLYILGKRVYLAQLTENKMVKHQVNKLMKLTDNMSTTLSKYLKKIPSTIKMSMKRC